MATANKGDWVDDPFCDCPECGEVTEVRDSFEMGIGSEYTCSNCSAVLVVHDTEQTRRWQWAARSGRKGRR